ncbi:RNA polymerase, sigma subunit, ECF family [Nannocystis exedens]|uniref:RNA polymerase, sigma subunit, ECF family n=1 Tax=Nannocystis exedens TaxID=54 RepID=A0A1I2G1F9_9BACT|nr:sigma-70 family RNA polymerase sigma factor [Nannocystis exedens]PCC74618.1 sigma-24 (FecI-like) protein [Nannocystis exedens]SFF10968.1 RNA polymerase, sigma subunit, ECF family [Nannocystis exedens]
MSADWETDKALLAAWRAGESTAGRQLYERHCDAVIRVFENKLGAEAEDLIQQTFLALVRTRDALREGTTVRAYLLTTARNLLIDHLRKRGRAGGPPLDLEQVSIADLEPGPSSIIARRREQQLLLAALRAIPVEHQLALELHYWEGLPAAEIAEIVGISHSAMRSRMVRARELLHAQLRRLAETPQLVESTLDGLEKWARGIREVKGSGPWSGGGGSGS